SSTLVFRGIQGTVSSGIPVSIQGNTIRNISVTTASSSTVQALISAVTGSFNIGNITGNTLGSQTSTGSVMFAQSTSSTSPIFYGILAGNGTPGVINVSNNTIGGISVSNSGSGSVQARLIGIQGAATGYIVANNTLGALNTPNSVLNSTSGTTIGIHATSSSGSNTIHGNVIANLSGTGTSGGQLIGIATPGSSGGVFSITGNTIRDLASGSPSVGTGPAASVIGIQLTASAMPGHLISGNSIHGLSTTAASANVSVTGIYYGGAASGANMIDRNLIYGFTGGTGGATASVNGIVVGGGSSTFQNNMIRLGVDAAGVVNSGVTGIDKTTTAANNFFHNTVYVGGSGVSSSNNSYAFRRTATGIDDLRNNIFMNERSNGSGTGRHYILGLNNTTTVTSNYNIYHGSGAGFVFGYVGTPGATDHASLAAWALANAGLDANSQDINPLLVNATGSMPDLHIQPGSPAEGAGIQIASVADDFDGQARALLSPTDVGADADDLAIIHTPGLISGTSPLCIGDVTTYTTDGDGGGSWSSSNTGVATVNASTGQVTAVNAGTADITYTVGAVSSFRTLTVSPNVSPGTISGVPSICMGQTSSFTSNGTPGGSWSSSNTGVATVHAGTGLVTGVSAGTADIIYTVNGGCGSPVSTGQSVTVSPGISAGMVSGTSTTCTGQTTIFTSNGTPGGSWSSGNGAVAAVNTNTGEVTGVGAGTADIIYTVSSGCGAPATSQKTLTVTASCGSLYYCTYDQGTYGNMVSGLCNNNSTNLATEQLLAQLLAAGDITIGQSGRSVIIPNTPQSLAKILDVIPGGGQPKQLQPGNCLITDVCFNSYIKNNGKINNILLSQMMTLSLNVRLDGGALLNLPVSPGWLTTQRRTGCTSSATAVDCSSDPTAVTSYKINETVARYLTNNGTAPATVQQLLSLGNQLIGGALVPGAVGTNGFRIPALDEINDAVSTINTAFIGCREFRGYYDCAVNCYNIDFVNPCAPPATRYMVTSTDRKIVVAAFPSPTSGILKLSVVAARRGMAGIRVVDMYGRQILSSRVNVISEKVEEFRIDISSAVAGVYLVQFVQDGTVISKRVFRE
ncbi:MAG TPA: Ig-like domain-containing protein, partial [Flavisolibacter sp.]